MKSFIVFALLVAAAVAAPPGNPDSDAKIVSQYLENIGVEGFKSGYETDNGISQQEEGVLTNPGTENEAIVVRGQFSYIGSDGVPYSVTYVADQNGFQPQGSHIPKA